MQIDWTAVLGSIATGVLSIGAVTLFMKNNMPKVAKWAMVAKDAVETLSDVADSLKDGNLTVEEVAKLKADVAKFQVDIAV